MTLRRHHVVVALLVLAGAALVLRGRCGTDVPPVPEGWVDDDGRAVTVTKGDEWVGIWVETHFCAVDGSQRPPERFRLVVDDQGNGVGTIGICRYGFEDCENGPVVVAYEARVSENRIDGTVRDSCNDYSGTEVFSRVQ